MCYIVIVFTSRYKLDELYSGNFNIGKVAMFDHLVQMFTIRSTYT